MPLSVLSNELKGKFSYLNTKGSQLKQKIVKASEKLFWKDMNTGEGLCMKNSIMRYFIFDPKSAKMLITWQNFILKRFDDVQRLNYKSFQYKVGIQISLGLSFQTL